MNVRSFRKLKNASDVQISERDGYTSRSKTIKAHNNKIVKKRIRTRITVSPANSKLVKEQIWINPVTSKIVLQPLEPDTDAHLHEEVSCQCEYKPKLASRVLQEKMSLKCGHPENFLSM